jgi:hypothetical protein
LFTVEMLPAQQGDALWIEYGHPPQVHRVLIDCGTPPTYPVIRKRIEALPAHDRRFELLIVSHIDTDHIGGVLKMLADRSLAGVFAEVWFNDFDRLPPCPNPERGPIDGAIMSQVLKNLGTATNRSLAGGAAVVPDIGSLPTVALEGGLLLTLLSPDVARLTQLGCAWAKVLRKAGLDPAGPSIDELVRRARRKGVEVLRVASRPDVPVLADSQSTPDSSSANGSSIAVLAEYEGRSCLFTADAFPTVLTRSLARLRQERGLDRLAVDAIKLPHHGSRRNVTAELVRSVTARAYLFSTDGSVFGHPDAEAVARVIQYGGPAAELVFNYRSEQNRIWDDPHLKHRFGFRTRYPDEGRSGLRLSVDDLPVVTPGDRHPEQEEER